jgi:hypothetical protein
VLDSKTICLDWLFWPNVHPIARVKPDQSENTPDRVRTHKSLRLWNFFGGCGARFEDVNPKENSQTEPHYINQLIISSHLLLLISLRTRTSSTTHPFVTDWASWASSICSLNLAQSASSLPHAIPGYPPLIRTRPNSTKPRWRRRETRHSM